MAIEADLRLLADFDEAARGWCVREGAYDVVVGRSAEVAVLKGNAELSEARLPA